MTGTLRAVGAPALGPDERVRLVVRMLLGMHEMSEIELGRRLGLARTPIYNRMQGRKAFTVAEVAAMAELFEVPPGAFLSGPNALLAASGDVSIKTSARGATVSRRGARSSRLAQAHLTLAA